MSAVLPQWMNSKRSYWPPEWDGDFNHGFDVGLLRLDRKAPLPMPQIDKMNSVWQDRVLSAASWRGMDASTSNGELRLTKNLTTLPMRTCEKEFHRDLKDHMICIHPAHAENSLGEQQLRRQLWSRLHSFVGL